MPVTRLAPSPTGALHLGNVRTFLVNWALARREGWRIVLRIEDLDGPRVKPQAIEGAIDTLAWLGMDWDEGPIVQSHDLSPYRDAMRTLAARGLAFPSELSRQEIEAAMSAPQSDAPISDGDEPAPGHEARCPPSLRPPLGPCGFDDPNTNWRFVTPDATVDFVDAFAGPRSIRPIDTVGDFVVWTKRGQPAYQLAVVVDDHRQGITHIVRGDDLLDSGARQLLLYRALGQSPEPAYCHLPLVVGPDGRRLAKRHGDTRVAAYRGAGATPERVVGLMARWCGITKPGEPVRAMSAREFASGLDLGRMPRGPIRFGSEDDRWLHQTM